MNIRKGIGLIFATTIISGISIFLNKFGVKGIDSSVFAFIKNLIVALFLFSLIGFAGQYNKLLQLNKKQWSKLALIGLTGGSIPFLLFFRGLQLTNGASAAFVHKTMFIYVAVLATVFLKEKLSRNIFIAGILLLIGNLMLLKLNFLELNTGTLMIFAATLFWAVENTISKHALEELQGNIVAFGRMFFGSLFILVFLLVTGKPLLVTSPQMIWAIITSIFLFAYVTTWYNGLKHVRVTVAATILLLGSPITTMISYFFLGAPVTGWQILGMLLLASGVAIAIIKIEMPYAVSTANP